MAGSATAPNHLSRRRIGRNDRAGALAESDAGQVGRLAISAKGDRVAVFEKRASLSGGQVDGFRPVLHLEETAFGSLLRARDCARCKQVARAEVATIARVMSEQLRQAPIEIAKVSSAELDGFDC